MRQFICSGPTSRAAGSWRSMGRRAVLGAAAAVAGLVLSSASHAVSIDWNNSSGDSRWNNPANWVGGVVPAGDNDATFIDITAGAALITEDVPTIRDIRYGDEGVGRTGGGQIDHSAGNLRLNGWFRMGLGNGSAGIYNMSGGMIEASRYLIAEHDDTVGVINVTGGTFRQFDVNPDDGNQWNRISNGARSVSTFNLTGGTVSMDARTMFLANGASFIGEQTGGIFEVRRGDITLGDVGTGISPEPAPATPNAVYSISGGVMRMLQNTREFQVGQWERANAELNIAGDALVESAGVVIVANGNPNAGASNTIGTVNQTGGRFHIQNGRDLVLGNNNTGNGTYNLAGGVLQMSGGNIRRGAGVGAFNMTGGELRDVGTISVPFVQAGGTLHPSDVDGGIRALTINSDYALGALGTLLLDVNLDGTSDRVSVTGSATLAGTLALNVLGDGLVPEGTLITILTPGTLAGTFLNGGSVVADNMQIFGINYAGGDGNDVVLTAGALIPEPATASVLGLIAGSMMLRRRNRRA